MITNAKAGLMPLEKLPLDVLAYGVSKGKLPASVLSLKPQPVALPEPPIDAGDTQLVAVPASGIKKMNVLTSLAAPIFDDLDDDLSLLSS